MAPSERLFTVRDKEKANCELGLPLRDGLFLLTVEEKSVSGLPPPGSPRAALLGGFWTTALAPSERLFTVRDREKANCELLLPLRDGLFPLPVEENAISELLRPDLNLSANRKLGRSESSRLENHQFLASRDAHF